MNSRVADAATTPQQPEHLRMAVGGNAAGGFYMSASRKRFDSLAGGSVGSNVSAAGSDASDEVEGEIELHPMEADEVPPNMLTELRTIFLDIGGFVVQSSTDADSADGDDTGACLRAIAADDGLRVTGQQVQAALEFNQVELQKQEMSVLISTMQVLTQRLEKRWEKTAKAVPPRSTNDGTPAEEENEEEEDEEFIEQPDTTAPICFEAFARTMYPFILVQQEVLDPALYAVFPDSSFTAETATGWLKLRRDIWLLLEDPTSSDVARLIALLVVLTILTSTISFCVETVPGVHKRFDSTFYVIECVCVSFFTVEFVLRASCSPEPRKFFTQTLNVIDFLAILPFYLELIVEHSLNSSVGGSPMLRAVRLIRVFRMLKIGRYLQWMRVFGRTLTDSVAPLMMLGLIISISILIFSTAVYFSERGTWDSSLGEWQTDDGAPSLFTSIPATFWWCIVSMTTVGYGDVFPLTAYGGFFAGITIFAGIMLMAIPISVISNNFHSEYNHMKRIRAMKEAHAQQKGPSPLSPVHDPEDAPEVDTYAKHAGEGQVGQALAPGSLRDIVEPEPVSPTVHGDSLSAQRGRAMSAMSQAASQSASRSRSRSRTASTAAQPAAAPPTSSTVGDSATRLDTSRRLRFAGDDDADQLPAANPPQSVARVDEDGILRHASAASGGFGDDESTGGNICPDAAAVPRSRQGSGTSDSGAVDAAPGSADARPSRLPAKLPSRARAGRRLSQAEQTMMRTLQSRPSAMDILEAQHAMANTAAVSRALIESGTHSRARSRAASASSNTGDDDVVRHASMSYGVGGVSSMVFSPVSTSAALRLAVELGVHDAELEAEAEEGYVDEGELLLEAQRRIDASWSEPFLRSTLSIVRNSRRKLMSGLKSLELRNRENAVLDIQDFVADIGSADRAKSVVNRATKTGLV